MIEALVALLAPTGNVFPAVTLLVVIAGMLVLAALDVWREEVEDYAVLALLGITVLGLSLEGIHPNQWLGAVISAAIAFSVYLHLGMKGVLGGGDVKLSIVPAFVLGAVNPVIAIWWIACAFMIHQLLFLVAASVTKSKTAIPHVPAMAAATLVSAVAFPVIM